MWACVCVCLSVYGPVRERNEEDVERFWKEPTERVNRLTKSGNVVLG